MSSDDVAGDGQVDRGSEEPGPSEAGPSETLPSETLPSETLPAKTSPAGTGPLEGELMDDGVLEVEPDDPFAALGGGLDMDAMMQMAQDMSERMGSAQTELADARVEGTAGGGLVKVVLNGHLHLLSVELAPGAIDPEDPSVAGDLVVAAWRDAHDEVARMQAATDPLGGLGGMGGLGGLLGGG